MLLWSLTLHAPEYLMMKDVPKPPSAKFWQIFSTSWVKFLWQIQMPDSPYLLYIKLLSTKSVMFPMTYTEVGSDEPFCQICDSMTGLGPPDNPTSTEKVRLWTLSSSSNTSRSSNYSDFTQHLNEPFKQTGALCGKMDVDSWIWWMALNQQWNNQLERHA